MHRVFLPRLAWLLLATAGVAHASPIVKLLTFQDTPDPVASTEQLDYEFQVSNTSFTTSADNVTLTVPIPSGATYLSSSDAACSFSAPNVICSFGTVPPSTDKNITVSLMVTASGGATLNTTATVTSSTVGESPDSVSQTTSVTAGADLQLQMSAAPNPVTAGGQVSYTLTATNLGPDPSSNLSVVDTLPPNVVYASSSGAGWSCSAGGSTVTCNRSGTLANGASSALTIVATVQSSISGTLTNSATLSAATTDGIVANNTATANVSVTAGADLRITKLASPSPMIGSQAATFTLQPRNVGPDIASSVTVTDTLPAGFTSIAASGTNWSCSVNAGTRLVTCTRASMPVGATNNISITATAPDDTFVPPAGLSTSNTASIAATTADPLTSNNSGTVNFTIQRDGADLSISKNKSPNPVAQGSPLTSTLRAFNNGPRAVTASDTITITDTLPAGEDYSGPASFTDNGWSCTFASPVFTCSRAGPLAVGQNSALLTLVTTAAASTPLTNQGCVGLSGTLADPNSTNNCVSAGSSSTAARADLTITKSQDKSTVTTGDTTLTYTLTIQNNGPQDSANVVVRDVIPMRTSLAGATVISANAAPGSKGSTGSCSVATDVVTCNYSSLLYENGSPGNTAETAVISITVQRPMADGAFTNTATIDSTSIGDPNRGDNTSSVNTTVDAVADVEVQAKTVSPNPVKAGVDATYVITFRNQGPSAAQGVTLSDQFNPAGGDAGYEVRSLTASQGSCSFNAGTNLVTCNVGTLNANEVETLTAVVRPIWMASPPPSRALPNTATVATTTFDADSSNDSKSANLTIDSAAVDLIVNVVDVPSFTGVAADPLGFDATNSPSNVVSYRVTATNSGPSQATNVAFTDTYTPPSGRSVTFLCDSSSPLACSGSPICTTPGGTTATGPATLVASCAVGSLEAGTNSVRYLRYRIDTAPPASGDSYSNAAVVSADETDSNNGNNSATEPTAVRAKADLQVSSKTAIVSPAPLQYGQTFQWQIKVLNGGPGIAYDSVLTDSLPSGMRLVSPFAYSVSPGAGACSAGSTTQFSCNLGDLSPGAGGEQTVTVDVIIPRPATGPFPTSYTNTASVTTFSVDLVAANNSNTGSVNLVKSSVVGRVYKDHNNNGTIDSGEGGVASVALTLAGTDVFGNAVSRNATTDSSGNYLFDNLEQANATGYTITETQPSGYDDGLETVGTASGAKVDTVGSNVITAIALDKDQAATGYNFGELRRNTISGTVYADSNGNNTKDSSAELGISGITVTLTGTDARGAAVNRPATTDSNGAFSFTNVLPGTYTLTETQPTTYIDGGEIAGTLGGTVGNDVISAIAVTDTNGTGYFFGELPGTVSGTVWRDVDRNGVLDAGEVGISGVSLALSGTDSFGTAVSRNVVTDSNGAYNFGALPEGTYSITETQPAGYGSSTPNTITGIHIVAAGSSPNHNFGETTSSLSGVVFFDRNENGTNDGSDSPIGGVTLTLGGTDARNAAVNRTTTTNASGAFTFADVLGSGANTYTITQTQPTAYSNGTITAGTSGGTVTQSTNTVSAISLAAATDATNYRFAEWGTRIGGVVYRDANRNSAKEAGELGLVGVTVTLLDSGNATIATTTTAADGTYSFPPQPGGSYTVNETQPAGYASGPQHTSNSVAVALVAGTPGVVDFGESAGSFSGVVFLDSDNDGVQDAGEIGLPGISLALTGTDANGAAVSTNATTNASGVYTFNDLLSGTYTITETQPAAFADGLDVLGAGNVGGAAGNDVYSAIALSAGVQATGYNFSEHGSAVTGVVFRDANRDGTQQAGDSGISGVTITLKDGSNVVVSTTTTASDGSYIFAGMPAGNYTIEETQPAGYGSAVTSPNSVAVSVPAGGAATASFADTLSTLAGSVYIDLNNNGMRDSGEPGINGVSVTLTGTDAAGAAVNRPAVSDSNGNFLFIDLLTPNGLGYRLAEPSQPAAYADGTDNAGTAGGVAGNDFINAIALSFNSDATGYGFAELGTSITGAVFKDSNANGTRDGGELGIAGVTLTLRNGLNAVVGTTVTAADGSYSFVGLPSGNYTVEETQPAGYGSSTPDSRSVTLAPGASTTALFGETTSSLSASVWADSNNNGQRDAGEPGIAGVTVALTGAASQTAVTNANGDVTFEDLLSGTYTITETQPAGYADGLDRAGTAGGTVGSDSISAIALPAGTAATGYLFAELGQSISGTAWLDSNRDSTFATTEAGISAVTITLRDSNGAVVTTTVTDANGRYAFANIPAGRYSVEETQPAGYGSETPDTVAVDLTTTGAAPIINFGDTAGSIVGVVFNDTNNNGIRDVGEPPIAGVSVRLQGTDVRGNPVNVLATTRLDGVYRLADVVGGTYTLTETQPVGFGDGLDIAGSAGGVVGNDSVTNIVLGAAVDATGYMFGEQGTAAAISGNVWRDADHDHAYQSGERSETNWIVELYQSGTLVQTSNTDSAGHYQFSNIAPGSGYDIRFVEPTTRTQYGPAVTNERGLQSASGVISTANPGGADFSAGTLSQLTLQPSASLTEQSLPLDPTGVVYDSVSRLPIAGARITISGPAGFDPATQLLGGAASASQLTTAEGLYELYLATNAPAGIYTIAVTPPPGRYTPGQSVLIPSCDSPLSLAPTPDRAVVQSSNSAPPANVPNQTTTACPTTSSALSAGQGTTQYFYSFVYTPGTAAAIVNNHLPVDPILGGALVVTKTTPMVNVSRGDLVPYTITVTNTLDALLTNIDVRDLMPPGFAYRTGSASINGTATEPTRVSRQLTWVDQSFAPHERKTYKLILVIGAGVSEAEYINQAYGLNNLVGAAVSNVATAAVRVVPDPVFDCSDIIGKVFEDRNANGYQDSGESGIANVRLATLNGVLVSTDSEGRYHVACAAIPNEYRGSNFVMKLDGRTLPAGFRVTTENPRDVRVTRGKVAKLNFGAAAHRVVRVQASDEAFESGSTVLKSEWRERISTLVQSLREAPSIVRVSYVVGSEGQRLANDRRRALIQSIRDQWEGLHCCYRLEVDADRESSHE